MPNRRVAVALVSVIVGSAVLSGCGFAGLCSSSAGGCTSSAPEVHNHYYEDDDSDLIVPVAVGLASVALIVAVIAARNSDDDSKRRPAVRSPAPEPPMAYVISAPTADNAESLRLQRMYVQGHLSASTGRCEATIAIARQMSRTAPDYHAVYAADPTIAACLRAQP